MTLDDGDVIEHMVPAACGWSARYKSTEGDRYFVPVVAFVLIESACGKPPAFEAVCMDAEGMGFIGRHRPGFDGLVCEHV